MTQKDWKVILNSAFESKSLKCPNCSKGHIFSSYTKIKPNKNCEKCSLKLSDFDVGDGPVYVAGFLLCFLLPITALIIEVNFKPSLLFHGITVTILTLLLTYLILIYSRSVFIHLEYKIRKLEKENKN